MATKNLIIRGGADFSGVKKELQKTQQTLQNFQDKVSKIMYGIGGVLGTLAVGKLIKDSTNLAMSYESNLGIIQRQMGESAAVFENWAKTQAKAFGYAKSEAVQYGATFSNLLSTFTKDTAQTTKYTQDMLQAMAVISSYTGRSIEDVGDRIRSGLLGSTEAIEDLGINVNISMIESTEAFRKFAGDRSWAQLDFQTQQQIRYFAILEQAASKFGTEVADNTASRLGSFTAALKDVQLNVGNAFLPILNVVLPILTALATKLAQVTGFIAAFSQALFGGSPQKQVQTQTKAIQQQSGSVGDLADSYKETGKAAKKASGFLTGFDEVNNLSKASADGGSSAVGGVGGSIGTSDIPMPELDSNGFINGVEEVSNKARELANRVRSAFESLGKFFKTYEKEITAVMAGIGAALTFVFIATNWTKILSGIIWTFTNLKLAVAGAWAAITGPIGLIALAIAGLVAAFVYFYQTNETFRGLVDGIFTTIKDVLVDLWNNVLVPLGGWLGTVFVASWKVVESALSWLWTNILVPIAGFLGGAFLKAWEIIQGALEVLKKDALQPLSEYFEKFWKDVVVPIADVLSDVLAVAFDLVFKAAKELWKNVLVPLGGFFADLFEPTIEAISAVIEYLWKKAIVPLGEYLGVGFYLVWKDLTTIIQNLWNNVLKPLIPFLQGALKIAFETIGSTIDGLKTTFTGLMNFITGVFTLDWEKAWNGVKDIFKGVFDSLYGIVKVPINLIIDAINTVIGGLNSLQMDIPDWVPFWGGQTWGINIPKLPKLRRGGIVDGATNFGNYIAGEAGAEMIVPLENTDFVNKIASAIGTAVMNSMGSSNSTPGDIVLKLNEIELGRAAARSINKAQRSSGYLLLEI